MTLNASTANAAHLLAVARDHHAHGRWAEADHAYRIAGNADPSAECWACHGSLALERAFVADDLGRNLPAAIFMCERSLQLDPRNLIALSNLAAAYLETGRTDDALATMDRAIEVAPNVPQLRSARLFALQSSPSHDEAAIEVETMKWRRWASEQVTEYTEWNCDRDPHRRLRIGYVSADWNNHAVERFIRPIIDNHDRDRFGVVEYNLRAMGEDDAKIAAEIHADAIDVLIDLSGHTRGGRPLAIAHRPAPVSIYYLGVAGDAGTCDYYITDRHLTPHNDPHALVIPSYWCYQASPAAPEVGQLPALRNGYVTFGSLNNFQKVTPEALRTWRRILEAVPDSRLLMFCPMGEARVRAAKELGEVMPRVEFVARQGLSEYFATYAKIDIALDTFPFAGGTTSCDALWMGVPVVTLAGNKAVARAGASIMRTCCPSHFIPEDIETYIRTAVYIAKRSHTDSSICRRLWRDTMRGSPLMDIKAHVRGLEAAYVQDWRGYCG